MKHILVVEITEKAYDAFFNSLPVGSTVHYDTGNPNDQEVWFDETSSSWNGPTFEEYNWMFLRQQQNWANDMLQVRGHLFLNEVYGMLGLPHTAAGALLGWVYSRDNKNANFVDFGCFNGRSKPGESTEPIDQERENAIRLKFNVDGPIIHLLHAS